MSRILQFHNDYHLGDCIYNLHYQIRLWHTGGHRSKLWCNPAYHEELQAFIPPSVGVAVGPTQERPPDSIDCWIGAEGYHQNHPDWHNYVRLYVDFFGHLSQKAGVPCPIKRREHMLFDSPAVLGRQIPEKHYDVLVINARPLSGQWDFKHGEFLELVTQLRNNRLSVLTTHPCGIENVPATVNMRWKIADIAKQSMDVDWIIGVDTGPLGSTYNVWNSRTVRGRFVLHAENFFTHADSHRVHKWEELMPLLHKHGVFRHLTTN